jgi:LysR family transcriptional activator of glutamate synthase operon
MDVDTAALRWFQLVADGETVTDVADAYGISQPGLSRALARLEGELGVDLLYKQGRVLRLTQAGATFRRHVDAMLHGLDDGIAALSELTDPETGHVRLGFQPSLGTWLVPTLVRRFAEQHPSVTFALSHIDDARPSMVVDGEVDLEITSSRPAHADVTWRPLLAQPLALAVPPRHRLAVEAEGAEVSLDTARGEPFIALARHWYLRERADALCERAGFTPRVRFELEDLPGVHGFVAAGLGVAIVPRVPSREFEPAGPLLSIADPEARRELGVAWSSERRLLPSAAAFLDFVISTAPTVRA